MTSHTRRRGLVLALSLSFAAHAQAALVDVVEFYNAALDHYFVTAYPGEIAKLDNGTFVGWQRTGQSFKAFDAADTSPGSAPVCRFYGLPAAGLDSHFYSASVAECNEVQQKFAQAWLFESPDVFGMYLPDTASGACPANTIPVYRLWNKRADSNHRYTTSTATFDVMVARGYVAEGYGPAARPVAMCSPQPAALQPPACTLAASSPTANTGAMVLLNANCSGNPTSYTWSGCAGTGPSCTATSSFAGTVTYSVVASNANGAGAPATVQVTWTTPPPPPPPEAKPVCSLLVTAPNPSPTVGTLAVLESSCTGSPTAYNWTNCATLTDVCRLRGSVTGLQSYSVVASNAGGASAPATANLNWVAADAPPVGLCGQYASALYSDVGSSSATVHSTYAEAPGIRVERRVGRALHRAVDGERIAGWERRGRRVRRAVDVSRNHGLADRVRLPRHRSHRRQRSARARGQHDRDPHVRHRQPRHGRREAAARRDVLAQRPQLLPGHGDDLVPVDPGPVRCLGAGEPAAVGAGARRAAQYNRRLSLSWSSR